ncbi:MAG: CCA tRNA nucleotidyltransferase [Verrucomicrobiia bacterium]|jgi:poly(A) polymerase
MKETATNIVRRLRAAGHVTYFVGGCVRDMVQGTEPHDFDIATSATPEEVQALYPRTVPVGAAFGVVLVLEDDHQFEVATFRSDDAYIDGRRPTGVHYGSPQEDAQRRDFTVNGLFYDPLASETQNGAPGGRALPTATDALPGIIDYVGGRADIERRLVRTIGDPRRRFTEDKLRMLRAVRFAANLEFAIDPATFDAVKEMASQIHVVSAERIRDELIKILTRSHAGRGLELLDASGLLQEILPEIAAMKGVEQPPEFHPEGDVFQHTRLMLETMSETALAARAPYRSASETARSASTPYHDPVVLAFAVLLHDVGKPPTFTRAPDRIRFNDHDRIGAEMAETILRRLRFPNEEIDKITLCVREHMRFQFVKEMRPAKLKRILARATFPDELELHRIDCASSHRNLENYEFLKAKAAELPPEAVKPEPLLNGHDLLALGLTPGPMVGQILREVEELQLEERLKSRAEALDFAKSRVSAASASPGGGAAT